MKNLSFRKLNVEDLFQLQTMSVTWYLESFDQNSSYSDLKNYLENELSTIGLLNEIQNPNVTYYLVLSNAKIIGFSKLKCSKSRLEVNKLSVLVIDQLFILKEFKNQKIAQFLLKQIIDLSKNCEAKYLSISIGERDLDTLDFLTQNGFKAYAEHYKNPDFPTRKSLLMKRLLAV